MRPTQHKTTGEDDPFRARLDQIINIKHELVQLSASHFVIGLLLLKHLFALSKQVCERWVYDPYFQRFTGAKFFQHSFRHERSDLSHWRKRSSGMPR